MKVNWFSTTLVIILVCILIWIVSSQIREYHLQDDPMLHYLKQVLSPLHPIVANLKLYRGNKSYTINKEKIFLCLRDKKTGDYYPLSTLIFVLTHEISHSLNTKDVGHTPEFHRIFEELLARAKELGIYNPEIQIPTDYCE